MLTIDDASGKMVKFVAQKPDLMVSGNRVVYYENMPLNETQVAISQAIDLEKWIIFCHTYYGIDIINKYDYYAGDYQQYNFTYQAGNTDALYDLILSISANYLIFN